MKKRLFCGTSILALGLSLGACAGDSCNLIYYDDDSYKASNQETVEKSLIRKMKLPEPTKEGYTFEGWYLDSDFTTKYNPDEIVKGDNELYAKWMVNSYRLVIHNDEEMIEYMYDYNAVIDLKPVTRYDFVFEDYYLDEGLTERFDLVHMPAYDLDLYPKFSPVLHYFSFVYHANNNEHFSSVTLERNELYNLVLPKPTREGYAFEGWFFDANCEEEFDIEKAQEGVNELFAKWNVNSYRIVIYNDDELIDYAFNYGEPIRINPLERFDYAFAGYYIDEEFTEEFDLVNMPSHDIYLFPKFTKILHYYSFFFIPENGHYYSPITLERDDLDSLKLPIPSKEGYTFEGWYLDINFEEEFDINKVREGNNELFAKWNVNSYKVVIHNEDENIEYAFDFGETIRVDSVEKYDYTFDGYFTDEGLTNKFDFGSMPSHDIDLYPKFTKILHYYTFAYNADNGGNYPSVTLEREVLNTLELPEPTKEGYTFDGWYVDSELINEFDLSKAVEGNNELFAKWKINTYEIAIHNNGEITNYNFNYGEELNLPENRNYEHSFVGYFTDEECNNKLAVSNMPAHDMNLYVKYCEHEWHKGSGSLYDMYCVECGYRSLPIININTSEQIEREYVKTTVSVNAGNSFYDINNASCKVKVRGNGTASYIKKPYRLKFDQEQRMLGLNNNLEAKSWVLLAEWNGWFLKNFAAFDLAKQILNKQYYSSDYCFVILTINNEYQGMYMLAEQQQVNPGRVDVFEPASGYQGTDIGYLLEMDIYAEEEDAYFSMDYRDDIYTLDGVRVGIDKAVPFFTIKNDIYCEEQKTFINRVVQRSYDIIRDTLWEDHSNLETNPYKKLDENLEIVEDPSIKTAKEAVENVVDYESLLRMMILSELCEDYDLGWSSFYISYDASKENPKLVFEAPWDFDLGFDIVGDTFDTYPYIFSSNSTWHQFYNMWFMVFSHAEWVSTDLYNKYEELDVHNIISNVFLDIENFVNADMPYLYDNYCRWPEDCGFDLDDYEYFKFRLTESGNWIIRVLTAKRTNFENYLIQFKEEEPFYINLNVDNGGSIMVYEGKDYTGEGIATNKYALADISGGGQVNFKVIVPEGYEIDTINIQGTYKNLKGPSDTGTENVYRVTKVSSDLTITVTFRPIA